MKSLLYLFVRIVFVVFLSLGIIFHLHDPRSSTNIVIALASLKLGQCHFLRHYRSRCDQHHYYLDKSFSSSCQQYMKHSLHKQQLSSIETDIRHTYRWALSTPASQTNLKLSVKSSECCNRTPFPDGFCSTSTRGRIGTSLWAHRKKPKTSSSSSGSGFGTSASTAATTTNKGKRGTRDRQVSENPNVAQEFENDYTIFPPLDNAILETCIPSVPELFHEAGELPDEIYQRLDQIYGFPNFNRLMANATKLAKSGSNINKDLTLTDLMITPSSTTVSSSSSLIQGLFGDQDKLPSKSLNFGKSSSQTTIDESLECLKVFPTFKDFRVLHIDPMVLAVDKFFTDDECEHYIAMSSESSPADNDHSTHDRVPKNGGGGSRGVMTSRSPTVGKDSYAKAQRTSTTFYHPYECVPELLSKASRLLGLSNIYQWEEPQTVRYRRNEKFTWHLDALDPMELERQQRKPKTPAGQRVATLLVYLTDLAPEDGGATIFRDLRSTDDHNSSAKNEYLTVQPTKGTALLFFPAAGGIPDTPYDIRTIHCGEVVAACSTNDKWIAQLWLRAGPYQPSAPPGNKHEPAIQHITEYCARYV